jgi:hypothetical protein
MPYSRHTMGQDWGGRHATNPNGAPKVTRKDVLAFAERKGLTVKRDPGTYSTWWIHKDGTRYTLGSTNWEAMQTLRRMYPEN